MDSAAKRKLKEKVETFYEEYFKTFVWLFYSVSLFLVWSTLFISTHKSNWCIALFAAFTAGNALSSWMCEKFHTRQAIAKRILEMHKLLMLAKKGELEKDIQSLIKAIQEQHTNEVLKEAERIKNDNH